jgi:hypothetical protein
MASYLVISKDTRLFAPKSPYDANNFELLSSGRPAEAAADDNPLPTGSVAPEQSGAITKLQGSGARADPIGQTCAGVDSPPEKGSGSAFVRSLREA